MKNQQSLIRIEAENYLKYSDSTFGNTGGAYRSNDVDIEKTLDVGGGFNVGWIEAGEWLTYDLEVPLDGVYQVFTRVASEVNRNHSLKISIDDKETGTASFQGTGSWQSWQDVSVGKIKLNAGNHRLRLDMLSSLFNVNYIKLVPVSMDIQKDIPSVPNNIQPIQNSNSYKSVKIGGGGFVTGIQIHPQDANVMYARTDVGGLYRWDTAKEEWQQLLSKKSVGQKISLAVESVALDPNNVNTVYAAVGAYTHEDPGKIIKSTNGGKTWDVLNISLPMGGNGNWRWSGERLAVNPHNSNVVYFGSRLNGLWKSQDGGNSWNKINAIPVGESFGETKNLAGVTFIEFDESSSGLAYVGVAGKGVYRTTDGGKNWQSLGGLSNALIPQQGEINGDGELVVTLYDPKGRNGSIQKFNGYGWQNVTPKNGKNYAGLTVSESNPNNLFAVTYPMTPNDIYRSTDGGDTWTPLNNNLQDIGWYPDWSFWTLSGDLAVNPNNPNQVWLANGISIWKTNDVNGNTTTWSPEINGLEETVPFDAISTPGGASLITAIADFDGFRHENLGATPVKNHGGGFNTTTSIDYSSNNPNFLVRVGGVQDDFSRLQAGFSTDNGRNWQNFASLNNGTHPKELIFGNVAVSATNVNNIVWQGTNNAAPYFTKDRGKTWNKINYFNQQFGVGAHTHLWNRQQSLAADSVAGGTFYMYHYKGGKLVRTQDGGETWSVTNTNSPLPNSWDGAKVKTLPGVKGEVWVGIDDKGLYRSSDGGQNFSKITGVEDVDAFDFGKSAPNTDNPTLFVSGEIDGKMGVFGSTDLGNNWSLIDDFEVFMADIRTVTGDMNNFGRVYLGAGSNGFIYGDL